VVPSTIERRRSVPVLGGPAPSGAELEVMLRAAACAPDHGRLRPWRFVVVAGARRVEFGEVLALAYLRRCARAGVVAAPERVATETRRLTRAPLVVAVGARLVEGKIGRDAQLAAVAAATQNLLLAATELGYGSMWRSGEACGDDTVKEALGLRPADTLVGFVYLGTPLRQVPPSADRSLDGLVSEWTGAGLRPWRVDGADPLAAAG
jgi:nitroreductase